jgi:small conductance mechanosensitive channel
MKHLLLLPILALCLFLGTAPVATATSFTTTAIVTQGEGPDSIVPGDPEPTVKAELTDPEGGDFDPADTRSIQDKVTDWLKDSAPGMLLNLAKFLAILFAAKIVSKIAGGIVARAMNASKLKVSDLLKKFAINTVTKVVFFLGVLFALQSVGVNTGPILAAFGVVGFVVGFALQDTMGNFAAGIMILLYRPYDVGEVVNAGGVTGKVQDMSLVSTTMLTPDNQKIIIPNGSIWGGTITNITANDTRRVDLVAGIGYGDDIPKAEALLMKLCTEHPLVLKDPAPNVKVNELADSSVNFIVRPWSATGDYWDVYWDLTKSIKMEFDKAGISIPFPQQDVYMHNV